MPRCWPPLPCPALLRLPDRGHTYARVAEAAAAAAAGVEAKVTDGHGSVGY